MKKLLILPDIHTRKARGGLPPGEDARSINAVLKYAEERAPYDEIIQLGDFWDLPWWRAKTGIKPLVRNEILAARSFKEYEQDLEIGRSWLKRFKALGKKLVILEGNHDYRWNIMLEHFPAMEGRMESPEQVVKSEGGVWVPTWSVQGKDYTFRDLHFVHGYYARMGSTARATALKKYPAENVFFGHGHWEESYSQETRHMQRQYISYCCGCLCRFDQPYLGHNTANWQQMFMEIFSKAKGQFSYYPHRLFGHKFIAPNGKEYRG